MGNVSIPATSPYLTPQEVAARWRRGVSTIYRLMRKQALPHTRVGNGYLIHCDDLERYESEHRVGRPQEKLRAVN